MKRLGILGYVGTLTDDSLSTAYCGLHCSYARIMGSGASPRDAGCRSGTTHGAYRARYDISVDHRAARYVDAAGAGCLDGFRSRSTARHPFRARARSESSHHRAGSVLAANASGSLPDRVHAVLLPLVISTGMPGYLATALPPDCRTTACPFALDAQQRQVRRTVYGIGLAPVGLEARVGVAKRVAFVTGARAGIIEFAEPVPDPAETRLNFTADASAGAEVRVTRNGVIRIGYRFNHISNGGRRPTNPGMNSSMLDVGLAFLRW